MTSYVSVIATFVTACTFFLDISPNIDDKGPCDLSCVFHINFDHMMLHTNYVTLIFYGHPSSKVMG